MSLNDILRDLVNDIDGALGCSVVDLTSGMVLAVHHNVPYFTQSFIDAAGAAGVDIFRGRNVTAVERMLASQRGEAPDYHTYEMQMTSKNCYHFMTIIPDRPNSLLVLVTSTSTNLGMGWASLRRSLPEISPKCPS
ncbi:MAG: hypothetical protein Q9M28_08715 [Mariprofundaceae bacterium]|nr:hypothetical protein [Mariprofundaceae bacterium]